MFPESFHPSIATLILFAALSIPAPSIVATPVPSTAAPEPSDPTEIDEEEPSAPATLVRETIVVSADRLERESREVGSAHTVVTGEEIELRRSTSLAEALRTVPGLEVVRGGGPGQVTSVFVRGGSSSQTLVLVDGVRVNDPATGAFDFSTFAADQIERIEVVRGPQSTLYGSEAVAGVVSITTRRGEPGLRFSGLAEAGELGHRRLRAGLAGGDGRFDYALSISDLELDGVSTASERRGNREADPFESTALAARLGFDFAADGRVDLSVRTVDAEVANDGFDFLAGPVDDLNRLQSREGTVASLRVETRPAKRWRQSFLLGVHDDRLSGTDPDDLFSNFRVDSRNLELGAQADFELAPSDVLSFGVELEERSSTNAGSFDESVDVASAYLQNAWSWRQRLHLTAGVRHDDHSQFGGETTYRLAGSWEASARTRLHGSYGTGFKAPTLNDLFFPFFSNPQLAPETSEAFDLGLEHALLDGRLSFDVTYFDADFDDLIVFDFGTFQPQNVAAASSAGVELRLDWKPGPRFQASATHTYDETEDRASGRPLPRRPENRSTLALYFRPVPRWRGAVTAVAVSDRVDVGGGPMDDYERLDLTVQHRLSEGLEPYVRIENLFDEDYEEIPGFTSPGRLAVVGLSLTY